MSLISKQERDELRENLINSPHDDTYTTDETIIKLLDQLDAYGRVVEAAKLYKSSVVGGIFGTSKSRLFDALEALGGLEDED